MTSYDVHYFDLKSGDLAHIEKGYKSAEEAKSDADSYLYGYTYEIKEIK